MWHCCVWFMYRHKLWYVEGLLDVNKTQWFRNPDCGLHADVVAPLFFLHFFLFFWIQIYVTKYFYAVVFLLISVFQSNLKLFSVEIAANSHFLFQIVWNLSNCSVLKSLQKWFLVSNCLKSLKLFSVEIVANSDFLFQIVWNLSNWIWPWEFGQNAFAWFYVCTDLLLFLLKFRWLFPRKASCNRAVLWSLTVLFSPDYTVHWTRWMLSSTCCCLWPWPRVLDLSISSKW